MTCIVGILNKNELHMMSDSAGSSQCKVDLIKDSKIFKVNFNNLKDNIICGVTTSFRHINILKYHTFDADTSDTFSHKFIVTKLIPKIKELLKIEVNNEFPNILIGNHKKLFEIQSDFSVLEMYNNFASIGSGRDEAKVAMESILRCCNYQVDNGQIPKILKIVMKSISDNNMSVAPPFDYLNVHMYKTGNSEIVEQRGNIKDDYNVDNSIFNIKH